MYTIVSNIDLWPLFSRKLFWLIALLNLWGISTQNYIVDLITKSLLIPLLLLYYIHYKTNTNVNFLSQFVFWIGSLFLIEDMPETTITDMICFWAALLLCIGVITQYLEVPFFKRLNQLKRVIPLLISSFYFILIKTLINFQNVN